MEIKYPKVFMLAETKLVQSEVTGWLEELGVPNWDTGPCSPGEALIEMAGRRCYRAFQDENVNVSEQNPNLTRVREGNHSYIGNILQSKHGSVLEHASTTFAIEDCSRVVTHELVRHRLCALSQESLRFVRPTQLKMYFPSIFEDLPEPARTEVRSIFESTVTSLEDVQHRLVDILGMNDTSKLFSDKKKLQSSMRRLMPIGMLTGIIVTSNHRNWRHMIEMRTSRHAEEEIRIVFNQIADLLIRSHPNIYQDAQFEVIEGHAEITFDNSKV